MYVYTTYYMGVHTVCVIQQEGRGWEAYTARGGTRCSRVLYCSFETATCHQCQVLYYAWNNYETTVFCSGQLALSEWLPVTRPISSNSKCRLGFEHPFYWPPGHARSERAARASVFKREMDSVEDTEVRLYHQAFCIALTTLFAIKNRPDKHRVLSIDVQNLQGLWSIHANYTK